MSDISFDRAIAFAQELIRIPGLPGNEGDVAQRVQEEFETLGFHEIWRDDVGNVVARIKGRGEAPEVLLSCHLDHVDIGDPQTWEYPPFGGVVADGYLHGRGAMDIKGPLALQTYAAAHFLEHPPAGDIVVAHTVLEERGGWGMEHLLESGTIKPAAVIIGEATNGDICVAHRGRAELILEVQGVAGHASAPDRARNPIELLPVLLQAIKEFAEHHQDAAPLLGMATIVPTELATLPRSRNVIPDRVNVILDWRVVPGRSADALVAQLESFLRERVWAPERLTFNLSFAVESQQTYTGQKRERRMFTPGFLMSADHRVVQAAVQSVAAHTGRKPVVRPWKFATDGGHTCGTHGIPTIGFAPGEERYAHTNRERLELASARVAYEAYPELISAVQGVA